MTLKWKAILIGVGALILVAGAFYIGSGMGNSKLDKELQDAKSDVDKLRGQLTSLNGVWENKELGFQAQIKDLSGRLKQKQGEINVLDAKLKKIGEDRASVIIPSAPDDIVADFRNAGFRSCTRSKRPK